MLRIVLLLLLLIPWSGAHAAEFTFIPRTAAGPGPAMIRMEGTIRDGDAKKLSNWITKHPAEYLITSLIQLSSDGGSVLEAIKVADLVEKSGWTALVDKGDTCASSCFLIFAAAQSRISIGQVIIHRPYFDKVAKDSREHLDQIEKQGAVAIALRNFLMAKGVSGRIIDTMMSLPSSQGHIFTSDDYRDLGYLAPVAEEQAIRRCGFDNTNFLAIYSKSPQAPSCLEAIFIPLRNSLIESWLGTEKLKAVGPRARDLYLNSPAHEKP
jgi:hypothetical protein